MRTGLIIALSIGFLCIANNAICYSEEAPRGDDSTDSVEGLERLTQLEEEFYFLRTEEPSPIPQAEAHEMAFLIEDYKSLPEGDSRKEVLLERVAAQLGYLKALHREKVIERELAQLRATLRFARENIDSQLIDLENSNSSVLERIREIEEQ